MIIKNNKEETRFIAEIIKSIKRLNMNYIESKKDLESIIQELTHNTDKIWLKHSKVINIMKHSKL